MRCYVITGGGAAGLAAAESIRKIDPSASLTMVGNEPYNYYSRPGLAYFLAGEVPKEQLFPYKPGFFRSLGINQLTDTVARIDPEGHCVELKSGKSLDFDRLLIATGAVAVRADVPGSDLQGIVKLDNMDDVELILHRARRGKTAVVIGGGITALELVEGLVAREMKVHYLLRGDRYWSNVLDPVESRIIEGRLRTDGVTIHYTTHLIELLGKKGHIAGVRAKTGDRLEDIPCDLAAIAIGVRPRKELASQAGLKTDRGILVDDYLCTSHPDVFAAGDVAQVFDPATGEYTLDSLIGPAIEQGTLAGLNMAGRSSLYQKRVPLNVTRLAGLITTIIGTVGMETARNENGGGSKENYINRGDSETWRRHPDAMLAQTYQGENRLRLFLSADRMVGAVVMGDQKVSLAVQYLMRSQVDIREVRQQLLAPGAPLIELVTKLWEKEAQGYAAKIA